MGFTFSYPWLLLALPLCLGLTWLLFWKKGRHRSLKGRVSLGLRSGALLFLCLALAGTGLYFSGRNAQLIVLADRSDSMAGERAWQEEWIRELEEELPENYRMAVVSFGGDSKVEKGFSVARFGQLQQQVAGEATDYEQALRFASALFDGEAAQHLLLLTDGRETAGDSRGADGLLSAGGARVDAALSPPEEEDDAQISGVSVPDVVYQNEAFDIYVDIHSQVEKSAVLQLYSGSTLLDEKTVALQKGENRFVFQDQARDTGLVEYRAVLLEEGGRVQNNRRATVARVLGPPKALLVEGSPGAADELGAIFAAASVSVSVAGPRSLPATAAALQQYDAVALVNVNAADLSARQLDSLNGFVSTLGRGLLVFGGDNSYALGGYIGSALEEMLPVESDVRNKLDMPSLAMVMAIDHSGSMGEITAGVSRLALAREAAQLAVEQLASQDQVGVVAFDDTAKWIAPLQSAENAEEVIRLIGGLELGGGTMMYSSIAEAYGALLESDAALKHLILLTDGQPADSGFEDLVAAMAEDHITVSTVAMGVGANVTLMRNLAELGGGRFYQVDGTDNIPAIFAKETQLSTQSYLQDRSFFPEYAMASSLTEPFGQGLPQLHGFMATVARPSATVALRSDNAMPILADWQYGGGRVLAWTSDVEGGWSRDFLKWEDSAAFFGAMLGHVLKSDDGQGLLTMTESGGQAVLRLEVGGYDQAETEATVIAPDGRESRVNMTLEKPGVFSADFHADQEGVYAVKVEQRQDGQLVNSLESGLPRGYSPEYDITGGATGRSVQQLVAAHDGKVLNDPSELFAAPLQRVRNHFDLTIPLLALGLLCFFLDVAARRLQWEAPVEAALEERRKKKEEKAEQASKGVPEKGKASETKKDAPKEERSAEGSPKEERLKKEPRSAADMSAELLARRRNRK